MDNVQIEYCLTDFSDIFDLDHYEFNEPVIDELELTQFLRESSCAREVFPEEVWIKVFNQVIAPEDLLNLSYSSTYFRQLISHKRVTFLFDKVFKALAPQYEQYRAPSCYREDDVPHPMLTVRHDHARDLEYGYRVEHLKIMSNRFGNIQVFKPLHQMTGIMKCRLVCLAWNKAVENYYENLTKQASERGYGGQWEICIFRCGIIHTSPSRFMKLFDESHNQPLEKKNPFLGRSVEIDGCLTRNRAERLFMVNLNRVLVAFGMEIWYCEIKLEVDDAIENGTCTQLYLRLIEWLALMPNLKKLVIKSNLDTEKHTIPEDMERLATETRANPIPTLTRLEILEVDGIPAKISDEIIRSNNHVSELHLRKRKWRQEDVVSYYKFKYVHELGYKLPKKLNNLTKLEIKPFSEKLLKYLEVESECAPNLDTLKIHYSTGSSSLDWERVLKVVGNKWGGSLKELDLKIGSRLWNDDERKTFLKLKDGCELKLEMLERLTIYLYQPMQLDFLLSWKKTLNYICFVTRYDVGNDCQGNVEMQSIEFYGFEKCMEKSNIWDIFRKLKTVEVKRNWISSGGTFDWNLTLYKRPRK